jgi:putative membrane protein
MVWPALIPIGLAIWLFSPWGIGSLALVPLAALLGYWQFRSAGWAIVDGTLVVRSRGSSLTTALIPRRRIQFVNVSESPFQRRARLASLDVRVASGSSGAAFGLLHLDKEVTSQLRDWIRPEGATQVHQAAGQGLRAERSAQ